MNFELRGTRVPLRGRSTLVSNPGRTVSKACIREINTVKLSCTSNLHLGGRFVALKLNVEYGSRVGPV